MLVKCDTYRIIACGVVSDLDRKILSFLEFVGKLCFDIAHMKDCAGLFHTFEYDNAITQKRRISRCSGHPILHQLWDECHKEDDNSLKSQTYKDMNFCSISLSLIDFHIDHGKY